MGRLFSACNSAFDDGDDDDDDDFDDDDFDYDDYDDDDCGNSAPLFCMQLCFQTSLNLD